MTEKSKIALASYARSSLPKLSPCYCALHCPIVPCNGGHHEKVGGHIKNFFPVLGAGICAPTFEMLPAPLRTAHMDMIMHRLTCHTFATHAEYIRT